MAILELTLESAYWGQRIINRWNYVATGTPAAVSYSFALISALGFLNPPVDPNLGTDFYSRLRQLQNVSVSYRLITAVNVYSDTDFFSNPISDENGLTSGQQSAPFLAFGFKTNQVTKRVRPGQKRFTGVRDEDTESGGSWSAGTIAAMENLAIEMSEVQSYDDSGQILTFKPAICAREKYTTPSGGTAYRYYPTEGEQLEHTAQSVIWEPKDYVRSQTTRQRGRGV